MITLEAIPDSVLDEFSPCAVEFVQAGCCANPQRPPAVLMNGPDAAGPQTERVIRFVQIVRKRPRFPVEPVQSSSTRTDPDIALSVFVDGPDPSPPKRVRILNVGNVMGNNP